MSQTEVKEEILECQACARQVSNAASSQELIQIFKELICIEPVTDQNVIVFCNKCEASLRSFQLFKKLCVHTQEMFTYRLLNDGHEMVEEYIVEVQDEQTEEKFDVKPESEKISVCFICDVCQKQIQTKRGLVQHMKKFHANRNSLLKETSNETQTQVKSLYECKECHTQLSSMRNLMKHLATHNTDKCFKCSYCDSTFNTQQNQYYHEKYVHKLGKQYVCSHCAYICYNPTLMNQHNQRHHNETKYCCDQCPKECKTPGDLRDHKLVHKNLEKSVPCPGCKALFKHKKSMQNHYRTVHIADRKYVCETCSKGFVSSNRLKRHLVTHTGERNFPCTFCSQAFTQLSVLKRHLTTHTGVRPFACPYCNHTFAESYYMKKHASRCSKKPTEA